MKLTSGIAGRCTLSCSSIGATVLHAVAGFTGRGRVKTATLVDAGGRLPLVLTFVDTAEHIDRVLPHVREMAAHRLIVRENVTIEAAEFE
jgi:PII-like signaling protein